MQKSLLAIELGDTFVRVRYIGQDDREAIRPPLEHSYGGDIPAIMEVGPNGAVTAYGIPVLTRLRSGDVGNFICTPRSGFAADPKGFAPMIVGLYQSIAADLQRRVLGEAITEVNGWSIVAAAPDDWTEIHRAHYQQALEAAFPGVRIALISALQAALNRLALSNHPALAEDAVLLYVEFGTRYVNLTGGVLRSAPSPWEMGKAYSLEAGGAAFDIRFVDRLFGAGQQSDMAERYYKLEIGRDCKETFSHLLAQGPGCMHTYQILPTAHNGFRTYPVQIECEEFKRNDFAGDLLKVLQAGLVTALHETQERHGRVDLIAAWGGGANWPFVPDLLHTVAPGTPVIVPPSPQEVAAQGLLLPPPTWPVRFHSQSPVFARRNAGANSWLASDSLRQGAEAASGVLAFLRDFSIQSSDRTLLEALLGRMQIGLASLAVFGRTASGKSSVINALVGEVVAPKHATAKSYRKGAWMLQETSRIPAASCPDRMFGSGQDAAGHLLVLDGIPHQDEMDLFNQVSGASPDTPCIVFVNKADTLQPPIMSKKDRDTVQRSIYEKMRKYVADDKDIVYGSVMRYDPTTDEMVRQEIPMLVERIDALLEEERRRAARFLVRTVAAAEAETKPLQHLYDNPGVWARLVEHLLHLAGRDGSTPENARALAVILLKYAARVLPDDFDLAADAPVARRTIRLMVFGEAARMYIDGDLIWGENGPDAILARARAAVTK